MTNKLAITFSIAAVALAACAGTHDTVVVGSAETAYVASAAPVTIGGAVRPGAGKVTLLTDPRGPIADISSQRVSLRMKDGSRQDIIVRGEQLTLGEEIRIRQDNSIRREPKN